MTDTPEGVIEKNKAPDLSYGWILLLLFIVGLVTLFPLIHIRILTNDDLKTSNTVLAGGLPQFISTMWSATLRDGRMHFFKIFNNYLPYAVDSFIYFKTVMMAALIGGLLLFSYFMKLMFESKKIFYLSLLISLVGLQISWDHNAILCFGGQHTVSLAYLLCSFITYLHYLRKNKRYLLGISVITYALALFPYEMFVVYIPVYLLLGLWEKKNWRESLRKMIPHFVCLALFIMASFCFYHFRTDSYAGATASSEIHPDRILRVMWQYSVSSVPGYFFASPGYRYLIRSYQEIPGRAYFLNSLKSGWMIKALLAAVILWILMRREENNRIKINRSCLFLFLAGVAYFFSPPFLPALTEHYQEAVIVHGQKGMQVTYYSYFGFLWMAVLALMVIPRLARNPEWRFVLMTGAVVVVGLTSLVVDCTNYNLGKEQAKADDRWKLVDQFLKSPAYREIPEDSFIYAPSLFRPFTTLNFGGQALDPTPPSATGLYNNYWNFYFNYRGKKTVHVLDPIASIPSNATDFYYLKYISQPNSRAESLIFCQVTPGPSFHLNGLMLTDRVFVYDWSPSNSVIIGGRVQSADSPTTVSIQKGDFCETNAIFVMEADERSYTYRQDLKELILTANKEAIQPDSIFVSSGQLPPLMLEAQPPLTKLKGWWSDGWIGPEATAQIQIRTPKKLIIEGFLPGAVYKALGWPTSNVTVKLNNVPIRSLLAKEGESFRIEQDLSGNTTYLLTINCDRSFVPSEKGLNRDLRTLSLVITEIQIE